MAVTGTPLWQRFIAEILVRESSFSFDICGVYVACRWLACNTAAACRQTQSELVETCRLCSDTGPYLHCIRGLHDTRQSDMHVSDGALWCNVSVKHRTAHCRKPLNWITKFNEFSHLCIIHSGLIHCTKTVALYHYSFTVIKHRVRHHTHLGRQIEV